MGTRAARRHNRAALAGWLQAGLLAGLAGAALALLSGNLAVLAGGGFGWRLGAALAAVAWLIAAGGYGARRGLRAARAPERVLEGVDQELGLRSQVSGGYALARSGRADGFAPLAIARAEALAGDVDLERALPLARRDTLLVLLLAAFGALALFPPPLPADPTTPPSAVDRSAGERAQRAAERLRNAAAELRRGADGLTDPQRATALRQAEVLERAARALDHGAHAGTSSERVAQAALARATGNLARAPQAARELAEAGASLGDAALGRRLGAALSSLQPGAFQEAADALAGQLDGGVPPEEQQELADAAAEAAKKVDRAPELREALEQLAQVLVGSVPGDPSEEGGAAARELGRAGQDPLQTALQQQLSAQAAGEARRAWEELAGGGSGDGGADSPGEPAAASEGGAPGGEQAEGSSGEGEERKAAGGGRRAGAAQGGAPARGASGTTPVAGRGSGAAPRDAQPAGAAQGGDARLRGALGSHGRAVSVALDELRRGAPSANSRDLVIRYGQVEEAALRRDPIPPERRELVRTYLEAIRR